MPRTSCHPGLQTKKWILKVVLQPCLQNRIFFLLVKLCLSLKDESCSFKIEQAMVIFVRQGEAKKQFHKILNSSILAPFWDVSPFFCMRALNSSLALWTLSSPCQESRQKRLWRYNIDGNGKVNTFLYSRLQYIFTTAQVVFGGLHYFIYLSVVVRPLKCWNRWFQIALH